MVVFKFENLKSMNLKNNCQYKLVDINLTIHDVSIKNFAQTKTLVIDIIDLK